MTSAAAAAYNGGMKRSVAAAFLGLLLLVVASGCGSVAHHAAPNVRQSHTIRHSTCHRYCFWVRQEALDAAAHYAKKVAGDAHVFGGVRVDNEANKTIVYLVHAPQSVIDQLNARHPGTYVIHNDARRTLQSLLVLQRSMNFAAWRARGIEVVSSWPTSAGYLMVGVASNIAEAQAALDARYGSGIIRVVHGELVQLSSGGPAGKP